MAKSLLLDYDSRVQVVPSVPVVLPNPNFPELVTLREIARALGSSHSAAYSLACSGALGDPIVVGRTHLYRRATAENAITLRKQQLRRNGTRAPLVSVA
jgi:hypothetical protein